MRRVSISSWALGSRPAILAASRCNMLMHPAKWSRAGASDVVTASSGGRGSCKHSSVSFLGKAVRPTRKSVSGVREISTGCNWFSVDKQCPLLSLISSFSEAVQSRWYGQGVDGRRCPPWKGTGLVEGLGDFKQSARRWRSVRQTSRLPLAARGAHVSCGGRAVALSAGNECLADIGTVGKGGLERRAPVDLGVP